MRIFFKFILSLPIILALSNVFADELVLKNGGRIKGVIVEENAKEVVIKIGGGKMRLARKKIKEIIRSKNAANKKLQEKQKKALQGPDKGAAKPQGRSPEDLFKQLSKLNEKPKTRMAQFVTFIVPAERKVYALNLTLGAYSLARAKGAQAQTALDKIAKRYELKNPFQSPKAPPVTSLAEAKKRADAVIGTKSYKALVKALEDFLWTFDKEAVAAGHLEAEVKSFDIKGERGIATLKSGQRVPLTKLSGAWYLSMRNLPK